MANTGTPKLKITIESNVKTVEFRFADNGHGLSGVTIDELSEPFHTTRASGDGMGLGLAISHAIVKEHNGTMEAHDRKSGGAEFIVKLPKSKKQ